MTDINAQLSRLLALAETAAVGAAEMTPIAIQKIGMYLQTLAIAEFAFNCFVVIAAFAAFIVAGRKAIEYGRQESFLIIPCLAIIIVAVPTFFINFPRPSEIVAMTSPEAALMVAAHSRITSSNQDRRR